MARGNAVSTDLEQLSTEDSRAGLTGSLSVLSGAQKGATTWLSAGTPVTVGRGIGNDIVIRDQSVESEHVSLQLLDDGLLVNVVQGQITVDGTTHGVSECLQLPCTAQLQIGGVDLLIESGADRVVSGSALDASMIPPFSVPQSADMHDMEVHDSGQAVAAQVPAVAGSRGLSMWVTGGIALLLTGGAVLWQGGMFFAPTPEAQLSMSAMLESASFATLSVQQQGGQVTLSGFLETSEQSRQLNELIGLSGYQVDNNVLVGESLGNQVSDVFRVNGVPAEVLVAEGGVVSATTSVAADTPFARLEETVMTDVPGVASITIHNTPPPPVEKKNNSSAKVDAGKRVAMVVSDYPAHIVTEDHSRYFVGSILPTGHRIASIDNGVVSLEKMGVQSKLEF